MIVLTRCAFFTINSFIGFFFCIGDQPRKAIKKDQLLGVKCSLLERKVIEYKAGECNVSVSEYLRKLRDSI